MKKKFLAILAAIAVLALATTACSSGGDDDEGDGSDNTTLRSIKIAQGAETQPDGASRNADKSAIAKFTDANVSKSQAPNAEVTLNFGTQFTGKADVALNDGDFKEYDPSDKPKITFADGDKFYVKMTAGDKSTVVYYGFGIKVGWDASLTDIVFTNEYAVLAQTVTEDISVDDLGTPKDTLAAFPDADRGKIQFLIKQPAAGFKVKGIPNDPDAAVTLAKDDAFATALTAAATVFAEGDSLFAKVVSGNGQVTQYYKIVIALKRAVIIPYGTPTTSTVDAANPAAIWDTGATDWLPINRSNATEGTGWLDLPVADRSFGQAKLLWDEDGIWVYAQVWEKTVSSTPGDHTRSSVELFVNEMAGKAAADLPSLAPNGTSAAVVNDVTNANTVMGGQYRLGANGERTGSPAVGAVDAFDGLGQYSAVKKTSGMPTKPANAINSLDSGYVVIFQAPWRFLANPADFPGASGSTTIAIELQINATDPATGNRAGVLNWNNISSNSYSSLVDYGEATLKAKGSDISPPKPAFPKITSQPVGGTIKVNAPSTDIPTLKVTATSEPGTTLTYKWFKSTDNVTFTDATGTNPTGTLTSGTEGGDFIPDINTAQLGSTYFYVQLTVTNANGSRNFKSSTVLVLVFDPSVALTYYVDLSKHVSQSFGWTNGYPTATVTGTYNPTTGTGQELKWSFAATTAAANNNNGQVGCIALPEACVPYINATRNSVTGYIKFTVTATTSDDTATYRSFLAKAAAGSYNAAIIGADGVLSGITGERTLSNTFTNADATTHFMLQGRDLNKASVVTITSIKVEIKVE